MSLSPASYSLNPTLRAAAYVYAFLGTLLGVALLIADERKEPEDFAAMGLFVLLFGAVPFFAAILGKGSARWKRMFLVLVAIVWPAAFCLVFRYA